MAITTLTHLHSITPTTCSKSYYQESWSKSINTRVVYHEVEHKQALTVKHICHWASEGKISHPSKKIVLPYKNVLGYPYKWKKNNFWLIPKATDILQKKRRVCPRVFSDVNRMLRRVQCIVQVRRENSSRNSISLNKQNRQCFNSIRHSPPADSERRSPKNRRSAK